MSIPVEVSSIVALVRVRRHGTVVAACPGTVVAACPGAAIADD